MLQDMEKHADELSDARTAVEAILSNPLLQALFSGQVRGSTLYTDLHMKCVYNYIYISYASNRIITFYNCDCNTPATYHVWQATVAKSASDDELRLACQKLAGAVSSYKQAAKSCRNLSTKPKAKAKAIAEPGANGAM